MMLTRDDFQEYKADYEFYGVNMVLDAYGNEYAEPDPTAKYTIHTMWHPLDDKMVVAEYGRDYDDVMYAIVYDAPAGIMYGDRVWINDEEYEVSSIRRFNTHTRIDVRRLKAR